MLGVVTVALADLRGRPTAEAVSTVPAPRPPGRRASQTREQVYRARTLKM